MFGMELQKKKSSHTDVTGYYGSEGAVRIRKGRKIVKTTIRVGLLIVTPFHICAIRN